MLDLNCTNHSKAFKDYEVCTVKLLIRLCGLIKGIYSNEPLQRKYPNRTRTPPSKYYIGGCPDHDNELRSPPLHRININININIKSICSTIVICRRTSQPRHTSRPSGGQATHTSTVQTQSAADTPTYATPTYASIDASTRTVPSSNLSPSQQS